MSESPRPDDHAADEAASSVLDGEATPAEADRVAGSAQLTARLVEFKAVADLVGTTTDIATAELDRIRAAAVRGAESQAGQAQHGQVVDLADAASRRRERRSTVGRAVSMAAALLLALGAGYQIAGLGDVESFDGDALDAAADTEESAFSADDSAASDETETAGEAADSDESADLRTETADLDALATEPAAQSPCEAQLADQALAAGAVEVDTARLHLAGVSIVVITGRRHDQPTFDVLIAPEPACEPVSAFSFSLG